MVNRACKNSAVDGYKATIAKQSKGKKVSFDDCIKIRTFVIPGYCPTRSTRSYRWEVSQRRATLRQLRLNATTPSCERGYASTAVQINSVHDGKTYLGTSSRKNKRYYS